MELNRQIRILDITTVAAIISAMISSILTIYFIGNFSENMAFSITALTHGGMILVLVWKRNQLLDKTW